MLYWMDVLRIRAAQSTKHEYGSVACCEGVIFVTLPQFRIYLFLFPVQEKFCELGNQNHKFVIRNRRKERKEATIFSFSLQNFLETSVGEAAMYVITTNTSHSSPIDKHWCNRPLVLELPPKKTQVTLRKSIRKEKSDLPLCAEVEATRSLASKFRNICRTFLFCNALPAEFK